MLYLPRLSRHLLSGFKVFESRRGPESEAPFERIQHMHHNHLVLLVPKMPQSIHQLFRVIKQVADENNKPPTCNPFGHTVEGIP